MTGRYSITGLFAGLFGMFFLAGAGSISAQENLDMGKSGAQLFASDCAICHKSPRGLSKTGGIFGVETFLREHYTASRQSAGAVAAYLRSVDEAQPPAERRRPVRARKQEPKAAGDKGTQASASTPKPEAKPAAKSDSKPQAKPSSDKKPD